MGSQNQEVFSAYTPFRNHLRKCVLPSSLRAVHAHILRQIFSKQLPAYIYNAPVGYQTARSFEEFIQFHIFPWELEIITKELIIHAKEYGGNKSLGSWNYLVDGVNKLKFLENTISKIYTNKNNVLLELYRIAHRQFPWQSRPNLQTIARYWKIYKYPALSKIIHKSTNMTLDEIFLIGIALIGFFLDKFALTYPPKIQIKDVSINELDQFLNHFGIKVDKLRSKLVNEQEINEKYAYAYNSLKASPVIRIQYEGNDSLICPLLPLLHDRLTRGLYYEIYGENGFDQAFGDSFQSYVGEVLSVGNKQASVIPERTYGKKNSKKTVDWIVKDKKAAIFVECKTKRITYPAKIELSSEKELEKQLDKMADFVIQVYKSILDYKEGLYPNIKYKKQINIYPLVVTLEEWYLFGDKILGILHEEVLAKFRKENLPTRLLTKYPYTICSAQDLENLVQITEQVGINTFFKEKNTQRDFRMWHIFNFIQNRFKNELLKTKSLFSKELDQYIESNMLTNRR